jgi:surfactin synthase thioesterase subunit
MKLVCIPYAGGGPAAFQGWAEGLNAAGIEICAVRLPSRESRWKEEPLRCSHVLSCRSISKRSDQDTAVPEESG